MLAEKRQEGETTLATRLPGPPELLPGRPDAVVDLQTDEGVALVGGGGATATPRCARSTSSNSAARATPDPLGPGDAPNRTYDVVPHADGTDFDDSKWQTLAPADTQRRLRTGRVCFNWYRINVTIPERVGALDPTGTRSPCSRSSSTTTPRSGSTASCRSRSATPAARSSAGSTHPIAWSSLATCNRASSFRSPCSASTGRSPPRHATTSGCAPRRLDFYAAAAG